MFIKRWQNFVNKIREQREREREREYTLNGSRMERGKDEDESISDFLFYHTNLKHVVL